MKNAISIALLSAAGLQAATAAELDTITVVSAKLDDVSGEEVKSADLAEALTKKVPGITLVRRSGIANDIILRGQKKDNINILIDNTKVYGACPNRMDPPTSHILTNNIDGIEVTEGPYDVENFGSLSGTVKITTQKPSKEFQGEVSLNVGSWDYQKLSTTMSGGNDTARFLISISEEEGDQYEDGNGDDFAEQIQELNPADPTVQYKAQYDDRKAFEKSTFMGKLYFNVAENHELMLSYTANRSDDILYPSSSMDALYDDSDIFNAEYSITDLGAYSKLLELQYYDSYVDHPMSTYFRDSSGAGSANEMISQLNTRMQGFKVKNTFDLSDSTELMIGADVSRRNWDGTYEKKGMMAGMITGRKSINDVDTENVAIFAKLEKDYSNVNLKAGLRYDDTSIDPGNGLGERSNDYNSLSAFAFATYAANDSTKFFGGIGKASRVPDARELYFRTAMGMMQTVKGTPTLDETTNYEIDLGMENSFDDLTIKTKLFYSWLDDYIYWNDSKTANVFENIDATIYGAEISGSYFATDSIYLDFGLAYQRGRKDKALSGQSDKDLAEIPPLKLNLALNYDYAANSSAMIEIVAVDDWDNYDSDNGEQSIDSYGVVNLKVQHKVTRNIGLTVGMDNAFDEEYQTTNTYKDLTLLADGAGDVMLMNDPGRYLYLNASYSF
ncbi:TonB-dependent receptor [Pseudomonadota bacterium]